MSEISMNQYKIAVENLLQLAYQGTSGSRAAAQVLLSAYNGDQWQLDVTDLCSLDRKNYKFALEVIRGRVELMIEPHTLIENGDIRFKSIWDRWAHFHASVRWDMNS